MVYAVMPVKGREELLKHTIGRLKKQTYPTMAICCGHTESEREVCEKAGAIFIMCPEEIVLGDKWQRCVDRARELEDTEAVMVLGSSDWIEDMWVERMMNEPYGAVGTAGLHFVDIGRNNLLSAYYWPGYTGNREGESIGAGRVIKKSVLDKVDWQLFDRSYDNSLDYSTTQILTAAKEEIVCCDNPPIGISISTYKWKNKHNFKQLLRSSMVSRWKEAKVIEFMKQHFPEGVNLFEPTER